ncbi:Nitrite reductase (NAD(P)H) [Desulfofarcimen acetoxidans DSM 771]|uniref:Nitrite reductase (NAD(P)H) n=1 Tax=Desulfofarcimen acetoxidans (strain ATCC 49208 / DSM 771 / KCTC 5769 / VKM B-1644 / 5575) TaxID=485916 RepID=C8VVV9_DESAS|nr:NAD(P)/FAD-dependent oxidoreductase [Desulfofarcimen acetoxidans]ACV64246.1 Nitrite reductase (NAD(P)H) [Desulfofarcimen acetoxidans DSM 771]
MAENPQGAILQRDKQTYAIVLRSPVGLLSADNLENIAKVVRKYNIPTVKITSAQRMALVGIKAEEAEQIRSETGMEMALASGPAIHYVQACPGTTLCAYGKQDSLGLALELEKLFVNNPMPAKTKISVSGCPMNCAEGYVRDIGIFASKEGWTLVFGGNSGGRPRIGDVIATNLTRKELIALVIKCLAIYQANAKTRERSYRFIERFGVEEFKKAVLE